MGGGGERHGNGLALEFAKRLHGGGRRHDDAVAAAVHTTRQHTDEQAAFTCIQVSDAIERAREVGHGAEVELAGDHFVGQWRSAGEVLPLDLILGILVPAVMRQVLLQQAKFANQQAAGGAVDGGVLGTDGDTDGFGTGVKASECQRKAGQVCYKAHGCFPSNRLKYWNRLRHQAWVVGNEGHCRGRPVARRMAWEGQRSR
ncbi:hypothetical protein D3C81_1583120 [compost metagenome]